MGEAHSPSKECVDVSRAVDSSWISTSRSSGSASAGEAAGADDEFVPAERFDFDGAASGAADRESSFSDAATLAAASDGNHRHTKDLKVSGEHKRGSNGATDSTGSIVEGDAEGSAESTATGGGHAPMRSGSSGKASVCSSIEASHTIPLAAAHVLCTENDVTREDSIMSRESHDSAFGAELPVTASASPGKTGLTRCSSAVVEGPDMSAADPSSPHNACINVPESKESDDLVSVEHMQASGVEKVGITGACNAGDGEPSGAQVVAAVESASEPAAESAEATSSALSTPADAPGAVATSAEDIVSTNRTEIGNNVSMQEDAEDGTGATRIGEEQSPTRRSRSHMRSLSEDAFIPSDLSVDPFTPPTSASVPVSQVGTPVGNNSPNRAHSPTSSDVHVTEVEELSYFRDDAPSFLPAGVPLLSKAHGSSMGDGSEFFSQLSLVSDADELLPDDVNAYGGSAEGTFDHEGAAVEVSGAEGAFGVEQADDASSSELFADAFAGPPGDTHSQQCGSEVAQTQHETHNDMHIGDGDQTSAENVDYGNPGADPIASYAAPFDGAAEQAGSCEETPGDVGESVSSMHTNDFAVSDTVPGNMESSADAYAALSENGSGSMSGVSTTAVASSEGGQAEASVVDAACEAPRGADLVPTDPAEWPCRPCVSMSFGGLVAVAHASSAAISSSAAMFDSFSAETAAAGPRPIPILVRRLGQPSGVMAHMVKAYPGIVTNKTLPQAARFAVQTADALPLGSDERLLWDLTADLTLSSGKLDTGFDRSSGVFPRSRFLSALASRRRSRFARERHNDTHAGPMTENFPVAGGLAAEIEDALLCGDREDACNAAAAGGAWGQALILASFVSVAKFRETCESYAQQIGDASPLRTTLLMMTSQEDAVLAGDAGSQVLDAWDEHVLAIVLNRTPSARGILRRIGTALWQQRKRYAAAAICILLADDLPPCRGPFAASLLVCEAVDLCVAARRVAGATVGTSHAARAAWALTLAGALAELGNDMAAFDITDAAVLSLGASAERSEGGTGSSQDDNTQVAVLRSRGECLLFLLAARTQRSAGDSLRKRSWLQWGVGQLVTNLVHGQDGVPTASSASDLAGVNAGAAVGGDGADGMHGAHASLYPSLREGGMLVSPATPVRSDAGHTPEGSAGVEPVEAHRATGDSSLVSEGAAASADGVVPGEPETEVTDVAPTWSSNADPSTQAWGDTPGWGSSEPWSAPPVAESGVGSETAAASKSRSMFDISGGENDEAFGPSRATSGGSGTGTAREGGESGSGSRPRQESGGPKSTAQGKEGENGSEDDGSTLGKLFGGIRKLLGGSKQADLGDEDSKFYFNKELGRWVVAGEEDAAVPATPPPPPTAAAFGSQPAEVSADLGAGYSNPAGVYADPSAGYGDPSAAYSDPGAFGGGPGVPLETPAAAPAPFASSAANAAAIAPAPSVPSAGLGKNRFSARGSGLRSRYVNTFGTGGAPAAPAAGPARPSARPAKKPTGGMSGGHRTSSLRAFLLAQ